MQALNLDRKLARITHKADDAKQIIMLLSTHRIKRLDYMLSNALKRGSSFKGLLQLLERAASGAYKATGNHTERDKDFALALYRLGGRQVVHMMHVEHLSPALSTVKRSTTRRTILACIRHPDEQTMVRNFIEIVLLPRADQPKLSVGWHIPLDEISCMERAVWLKHCDQIGGLSPDTTDSVDLSASASDNIEAVAAMVHPPDGCAPTVRFSNQLTVAAVVIHSEGDHRALPFLVAGGRGKKDAAGFRRLIHQFISVVESSGAVDTMGYPWSIATDGDSSRRSGGYDELLVRDLRKPEHAATSRVLAKRVTRMLGFNCAFGPHDILITFDPKHLFKRLSTSHYHWDVLI
jgi:hypothetical protein